MKHFPTLILLCTCIFTIQTTTSQTTTSQTTLGFKCTTTTKLAKCTSLIDYKLPNTTTLLAIKNQFQIKKLQTLLSANSFPFTTPQTQTYPAESTLKIPFPCSCRNINDMNVGISRNTPIYTVLPNDGLYHIAAEVFSGLVTFPQIQSINNISDANTISVGQKLWIPLPCSCDQVAGEEVVHYGYTVPAGSSVGGIAAEFNTTESVLLELNGMKDAKELMADSILDVPLKVCTSSVRNDSLDYPLLVPNGTYTLTANSCVRCQCNAANNWTLDCQPSGISLSKGQSCPPMQCVGTSFVLGNTSSDSSCNLSRCAYAGYGNGNIFTALTQESTCAVGNNSSNDNGNPSGNGSKGLTSSLVLVATLIALLLHLLR